MSLPPSGGSGPVQRKLGTLELGRGAAALAVVAHHAAQSSDAFTSGGLAGLFHWGIYGVDFFFVLSGFIIYHAHSGDRRGADPARNFITKRIHRIYVPYLPISIFLIALYLQFPGLTQGDRAWGWLTSLTLIPSAYPPALSVAWTLSFEMMFYLFFLLFYATRFFWPLVGGWAFIVLLNEGLAQSGALLRPKPLIVFDPLILEFIAGMIAAYLFGRNLRLPWLVPSVIGLGFGVVFAFLPEAHRAFLGVMAIGPAVLGLALLERQVGLRLPLIFGLLGASSYAIYLVHNPVQSMVGRLLQQVDSWALTFATCCLVGVIAGLIYHLSYERPALRYLARGHGSNVDTIRNERSY